MHVQYVASHALAARITLTALVISYRWIINAVHTFCVARSLTFIACPVALCSVAANTSRRRTVAFSLTNKPCNQTGYGERAQNGPHFFWQRKKLAKKSTTSRSTKSHRIQSQVAQLEVE
jgi:hypothetical protein